MGNSILGRMDDMGTRMDELEQSIASLLDNAGLDREILSQPPRSSTVSNNASESSSKQPPSNQQQQRLGSSIEI